MTGIPIEVLALADFTGETGVRRDYAQVRLGWDAKGPWAAATDAKAFVLARWARPEDDPPAEAVEFGVRTDVLFRVRRTIAESASDWRDVFTAAPGYAEVVRRSGEGEVLARGPAPGDWVEQDSVERVLRLLRADWPVDPEPRPLPYLCPSYLARLGVLAGEATPKDAPYEAQVRVRPVTFAGGGAWCAQIGEHRSGLLNRGLRLWALVMGLEGDNLREWMPSGGIKAATPAPIRELEPVLGGEG